MVGRARRDRRDRRDPPRPAEVAAGAVPRRCRLVRSPVLTSCSFVRSFVRRCGGHENAEPTTSDQSEGCPAHATLPRVLGIDIVRGCHVRSLNPLARGRGAGGYDRGPLQVETALAAVQAVRDEVAYVRTERSTCVAHNARIMHDVPTAAPLVRLLCTQYPFGRPAPSAKPPWCSDM